ncbi:hypothetical protein WKI13_10465 [Teredinibacter turnerae]|uniref:hypothetical protein n=1 Tax=Teredinibacter turnerae TaxID=2426 RepID=UPI0030D0239E
MFCTVCLFVFTCLISCGKQTSRKVSGGPPAYSVAGDNYKNKGLEITHPADWVLLHDEPGIIADRTVAFETPDASRITVFFYKSETRTYSDLANELEKQLRLRNSKDVKDFTRETLELGNYKGLKLSWVSLGLAETTNEASFLQLRAEPYPVLVQFHLLDDDIETQKNNLVPFLQGISLTKPR